MSQVHVERVIGLLATDEAWRRRFSKDPGACLAELNECERWSLAHLDPDELARFARAIGPRLQKAELSGGDE